MNKLKPIRFSRHALGYIGTRGFTTAEVEEAIRTCIWKPAELEKLECSMECAFNEIWNGKFYKTKQIRPVFVEEDSEIVIITVYTYYY